jgi:putative intracellular protease/amidase
LGKILCFVYDKMADFEVTLACTMINGKRYAVVTVGVSREPVTTFSTMVVSPAATLDEALDWDDVDGLLIPGGVPREQPESLTEIIQRLNGQGKLVAAICAGPMFLARAGVLAGRKFTHSVTPDDLARFDSVDPFPTSGFMLSGVVRDGNVITASGESFLDFAAEVMDYLGLFSSPEGRRAWEKEFKGL